MYGCTFRLLGLAAPTRLAKAPSGGRRPDVGPLQRSESPDSESGLPSGWAFVNDLGPESRLKFLNHRTLPTTVTLPRGGPARMYGCTHPNPPPGGRLFCCSAHHHATCR